MYLDGRQTATGPPSRKVVGFTGADLAPPDNLKCIWVISESTIIMVETKNRRHA